MNYVDEGEEVFTRLTLELAQLLLITGQADKMADVEAMLDTAQRVYEQQGCEGELTSVLHYRGIMLQKKGKIEPSRDAFQEALVRREELYGAHHQLVAESLGAVYGPHLPCRKCTRWRPKARKGCAECDPLRETMLRRALEIRKAMLGERHVLVASSAFNYGKIVWNAAVRRAEEGLAGGKYEQAVAASGKRDGKGGGKGKEVKLRGKALAEFRSKMEEAITLIQLALDIRHSRFGREHQLVSNINFSLQQAVKSLVMLGDMRMCLRWVNGCCTKGSECAFEHKAPFPAIQYWMDSGFAAAVRLHASFSALCLTWAQCMPCTSHIRWATDA